ncbi:MAG: hypothetical protein AAFO94_08570 [Bacteroidota bacterium]
MMHDLNIFIHVLAGSLGALLGFVPFFTTKGGKRHRQSGRIFLILLAIVIFTAFNGVLFFRDRPFLTVITFMSSYMGLSGYRALQYKHAGPGRIDLLIVLTMVGIGASFVWRLQNANVVWAMTTVYYTLGWLGMYLFYDVLRIAGVIRSQKLWLLEHIVKMSGAFSALFGTAMATVFEAWAPYNQILGYGTDTILLVAGIVYYFRKGHKQVRTLG